MHTYFCRYGSRRLYCWRASSLPAVTIAESRSSRRLRSCQSRGPSMKHSISSAESRSSSRDLQVLSCHRRRPRSRNDSFRGSRKLRLRRVEISTISLLLWPCVLNLRQHQPHVYPAIQSERRADSGGFKSSGGVLEGHSQARCFQELSTELLAAPGTSLIHIVLVRMGFSIPAEGNNRREQNGPMSGPWPRASLLFWISIAAYAFLRAAAVCWVRSSTV